MESLPAAVLLCLQIAPAAYARAWSATDTEIGIVAIKADRGILLLERQRESQVKANRERRPSPPVFGHEFTT